MSKDDLFAETRARFERFNVDLKTGKLQRSGLNVPIQGQPFQVLRLLLMAKGEVVTRDQLRAALWPEDTFVDFEHGLNTAVRKVRQALEDSIENPKFIETVPRLGYRFIALVEWSPVERVAGENRELAPEERTPSRISLPHEREKRNTLIALFAIPVLAIAIFVVYQYGHLGRKSPPAVQAPLPAVSERWLTANPDDTPVTSGVIAPDGKYLAYTDSTGFYLHQVDNGETRLVPLPTGFDAFAESWFSDSIHLVVSRVENPQRQPGLWVISILGGTPRRLADEGSSASVSPDGSEIVFLKHSPSGEEIWLMQEDGSGARKLLSSNEDNFSQLAWDPEGRRIAFARSKTRYHANQNGPDNQIEVFDLSSAKLMVVERPRERSLHFGEAAIGWTPDGLLIFPRRDPAPNEQDANLWWIKLDPRTQTLSAPTRLTNGRGTPAQLSLSKDGSRIALRRQAPQPDIYIGDIKRNGKALGTLRRLTLDQRWDFATSWTPDSKAILFYSNRDGPFHIFRQSLDATQPERLVGGSYSLEMPRLTPDGTSVLYLIRAQPGGPSNVSRVMRVPLAGGPSQFVLEDTGIWDIQCARAPSTLCIYSRIEGGHQTFFRFDPVNGKGKELHLPETDGDNFDWSLSPDGQYLAWAQNRMALKVFGVRVVSLADERIRDIAVPGWTEIFGLDWGGDSKSLWAAARNSDGARALLHVGFEGRIQPVLSYRNVDVEWAIESPDGRHLAVVKDSNSSNVSLLELKNSK